MAYKVTSEPLITAAYHAAGMQIDASAGLTTLLSLTLLLYILTVLRTRNLASLISRKMPLDRSRTAGSFDYETIISSYIDAIRPKNKAAYPFMFFKIIINLTPLFFMPFYLVFYKSYGLILRGCTNLLLERYGDATIVAFYEFHRKYPIDYISRHHPILKELDKLVLSCLSNDACAAAILNGKIQVRGYCCTKDYLNNFLKRRTMKTIADEHDKRGCKRYVFCGWLSKRRPKISCGDNGGNIKGEIVECSSDGSGVYIATRTALADINQPLKIYLKKLQKAVGGKVMHRQPLHRRNNPVFGYGIQISQDDRTIVLTLLSSLSH